MTPFDAAAYGASAAADYDSLYGEMPETQEAVQRLADLAGDGPIIELGVGTGRLALRLAERGLTVAGIEGSQEMADLLLAKPRGNTIDVTVGDFSSATVEGRFSLAILAFNTIFAVPDADAQVAVFQNVARHLKPHGRFVVESWILDGEQLDGHETVRPRFESEAGGVEMQQLRYDPATHRARSTQRHAGPGGSHAIATEHTYVWPTELDLMARLAGMSLTHRWGGWSGEPYTGRTRHVSVYELG